MQKSLATQAAGEAAGLRRASCLMVYCQTLHERRATALPRS